MDELDIMFNNLSIAYSDMDVDSEVKEINNNYLMEMHSNIMDIKIIDKEDMKHLHIIAMRGYYEICKNYIIGNNINIITNITNRIPLHYACMNNHIKIAELLLDNKSKINVKDTYGYYPIDYAAMNNNIELVKLLICCGAILDSVLISAYKTNNTNLINLISNYL